MSNRPVSRWDEYLNPESELYAPSLQEIEDERHAAKAIDEELREIQDELSNPLRDSISSEELPHAADPDAFWQL